MADSSTTAGPILDLIAGDCWARRQLRGGIGYVSVASKLMNPPTLVRVVFLKVPELDGRFLHNRLTDSGSDCGRLLGSTPATRRYKVRPQAPILNGAIEARGGNGGGPWGGPAPGGGRAGI